MIYLDASLLLSLLVADGHTERAHAWLSAVDETLAVSDLANLEVSAVRSRDPRTGQLTPDAVEAALIDFDALRAACERLSHSVGDFLLAEHIVRDFSLKLTAPDAPHLASATHADARLATFDERLAAAARMRGIEAPAVG
ncbi:MAG: type II toxin-antitoxin system VapC family toxin [Roseiarcus sp.]